MLPKRGKNLSIYVTEVFHEGRTTPLRHDVLELDGDGSVSQAGLFNVALSHHFPGI